MAAYIYGVDDVGFKKLYETITQNRWLETQLSFSKDRKALSTLDEQTKEYFKFIFCFLGMSEKLINFNILQVLEPIKEDDVIHYYYEQLAIETVHARTYRLILDVFYEDAEDEIKQAVNRYMEDTILKDKIGYLENAIQRCKSFGERVIILIVLEGIFFLSSFLSISFLRPFGFDGTTEANTYICRDEKLHTDAASLLFLTYVPTEDRPSCDFVHKVFSDVVSIEKKFIEEKIKAVYCLDKILLFDSVEATADILLVRIGYPPLYRKSIPKGWPLDTSLVDKNVCFFEKRNTEYCTRLTNDL